MEEALRSSKNESIKMTNIMKPKLRLIALMPLVLAGCQTEPVVTTTNTEVRQEVVRTQGDRVIGREVTVTKTPPAVQVETPTTSPDNGMSGHADTGDGPEQIMNGCPVAGLSVKGGGRLG
jgi:hypothetical protein